MINADSGSYKEIFSISLPLVISTGSTTLMHFTDRIFLSWYSEEALAAGLPGGISNFALLCLFLGPASYVSTFVAQYYRAKQYERIGPIVWQGAWFALVAGLCLMSVIPFALPIFQLINHPGNLPQLEASYFRILCFGYVFSLLASVFSSFFIGLGRTKEVMIVNVSCTGLNIILDYAWIFGKWGLPRCGIEGAAYATNVAIVLSAFIFMALYFRKENRLKYNALKAYKLVPKLLWRLLRYGLPNGMQLLLDIAAFTLFVLLVGRLGAVELAASNIAFNINTIAFMPMIGFGIAASTLVGQYLGRNQPEIAARCVNRIFAITITYMSIIALSYIFTPDLYIKIYGSKENPQILAEIQKLSRTLLLFVALFSFFDSLNVIFCSAIRGAGDTRFIMWVSLISSAFLVIIPTYLSCVVYKTSIFIPWSFFTFYVAFVGIVFLFRYRGGKWKKMRVIEMPPTSIQFIPTEGAKSKASV